MVNVDGDPESFLKGENGPECRAYRLMNKYCWYFL